MTFPSNLTQRKISLWTVVASLSVMSLMIGCDKGPVLNEFTDFTFAGEQFDKSSNGAVGRSVRKIEIDNQFVQVSTLFHTRTFDVVRNTINGTK